LFAAAGRKLAGAVLLCAAGALLIVLSRRALERNWSDLVLLKQNHELIHSGPYNWMRHPLYTGLILGLTGSALTVGSRASYGVAVFCFIGLFLKSRREEALLAREFPEYKEYRRRVKAFVLLLL
jgi:protein-S-isoprenylcysteine O-methyltransferase Ste14